MLKMQRPITSSVQNKASSFQAMARILWPPAVQDKVYPFAGSSLVLLGRLKLTHVIICTVLTTAFFIVAGKIGSSYGVQLADMPIIKS